MENFIYHTPTKLIFGQNAITNLPDILRPSGSGYCSPTAAAVSKRSGSTMK